MKKVYSLILIIAGLSSCNYTAKPNDGSHKIAASTSIAGNTNDNIKSAEEIKNQLHTQLPQLPTIDQVKDSPIQNLYEVDVGREVFYITKDGKLLVFGNIIDPQTQENFTQKSKDKLNTISWNKLPFSDAIVQVTGTGKDYKLAVFTDPECPYCQQFEKQVEAKLPNTTIYNFLFPLKELHPHAELYSQQIWCSSNRLDTFVNWMHNQKGLYASGPTPRCDLSGLARIESSGKNLVQVSGTPTFILENGKIMVGLSSTQQLIDAMQNAKAGK